MCPLGGTELQKFSRAKCRSAKNLGGNGRSYLLRPLYRPIHRRLTRDRRSETAVHPVMELGPSEEEAYHPFQGFYASNLKNCWKGCRGRASLDAQLRSRRTGVIHVTRSKRPGSPRGRAAESRQEGHRWRTSRARGPTSGKKASPAKKRLRAGRKPLAPARARRPTYSIKAWTTTTLIWSSAAGFPAPAALSFLGKRSRAAASPSSVQPNSHLYQCRFLVQGGVLLVVRDASNYVRGEPPPPRARGDTRRSVNSLSWTHPPLPQIIPGNRAAARLARAERHRGNFGVSKAFASDRLHEDFREALEFGPRSFAGGPGFQVCVGFDSSRLRPWSPPLAPALRCRRGRCARTPASPSIRLTRNDVLIWTR